MTTWLLVCLGAAAGAPARWFVDGAVQQRWGRSLPLGILVVNVVGSFVLGAVAAGTLGWDGRTAWLALVGSGFCGAFTTFGSVAYESVALAEDGKAGTGALNVVLNVGAALGAAFLGWWLAGGPV